MVKKNINHQTKLSAIQRGGSQGLHS